MIVLLLLASLVIGGSSAAEDGECPQSNTTCTYWFTIEEKLTMMYGKNLTYAKNGKLFNHFNHEEVPMEKVISTDGAERLVITVNDQIPGPPIIVYEGQTVVVHVKNKLLSDSVSIHWHGLHQQGTPYMDGVGWVTQCPIGSGQSFDYKFTAKPKGTFWYHSHVGAQRSNGLFGAFIIKERPKKNSISPEEHIMIIGDWHHESAEMVYLRMVYRNFEKDGSAYETTKTVDGGKFSNVRWVSALINGRGRYIDPETGNVEKDTPLTRFNVTNGNTYRFRVIQAGSIYPLRVSVDDHNITIVASDGYDLKPMEVESVIINPGERFDFLLKADRDYGNYWIRTASLEDDKPYHYTTAILSYENRYGYWSSTIPTTSRKYCSPSSPCRVVNCPFEYFPKRDNQICYKMSDLQSDDDDDPAPEMNDGDVEMFLNFAFPGDDEVPGSVNGRRFLFPGVNAFSQFEEVDDYDCNKKECGIGKICYCYHDRPIPSGKTIQMVWTNIGKGAGWAHPIHLHGHSFHVVKMSYPKQNKDTGRLMEANYNDDIVCTKNESYCNEASWKSTPRKKGDVQGLNLKNPPRKDTLIIPTGGYAVIRFRSDNPGKWFLHCHIEVHALNGMAMVITEGNVPPAPKGFPKCQHFNFKESSAFAIQTSTILIATFFLTLWLAM